MGSLFQEMRDKGYISKRDHPSLPYSIYNYTKSAQYEGVWNEATKQCRGLILDENMDVVARPFSKFFNIEEHEESEIPNENFEVYEKMDGSLGILYFDRGGYAHISTRGSFESEQAIKGEEILYRKYRDLLPNLKRDRTYLLEIIYKENRIVCDYGDTEDLILLAVIETQTGKELDIYTLDEVKGFPLVKRYDGLNDISKLRDKEDDAREGYVLKFKSGFRVKVKFEEYKRLHRILTNISNKSIWECLRDDTGMEDVLERVPDEFYEWVRGAQKELRDSYSRIEEECLDTMGCMHSENLGDRKSIALYLQEKKNPSILFRMLDKKDYAPLIWKMLKPKYQKPYKDMEGVE